MNDKAMRESLLQQNATASVEAELKMLHGLMEAENRRARQLTKWTIVVWSAWFALVVLLFGLYLLTRTLAHNPAVIDPPEVPAAQGVHQESLMETALSVILPTAIVLMMILVVLLPPAGIILLILQVLARRSATSSQLRSSVAAIDAQLGLLTAAHTPQPTDSEKGSS